MIFNSIILSKQGYLAMAEQTGDRQEPQTVTNVFLWIGIAILSLPIITNLLSASSVDDEDLHLVNEVNSIVSYNPSLSPGQSKWIDFTNLPSSTTIDKDKNKRE